MQNWFNNTPDLYMLPSLQHYCNNANISMNTVWILEVIMTRLNCSDFLQGHQSTHIAITHLDFTKHIALPSIAMLQMQWEVNCNRKQCWKHANRYTLIIWCPEAEQHMLYSVLSVPSWFQPLFRHRCIGLQSQRYLDLQDSEALCSTMKPTTGRHTKAIYWSP